MRAHAIAHQLAETSFTVGDDLSQSVITFQIVDVTLTDVGGMTVDTLLHNEPTIGDGFTPELQHWAIVNPPDGPTLEVVPFNLGPGQTETFTFEFDIVGTVQSTALWSGTDVAENLTVEPNGGGGSGGETGGVNVALLITIAIIAFYAYQSWRPWIHGRGP